MKFPKSVVVTDQKIDISRYGDTEKQFCTDLLKGILEKYKESRKSRMVIGFAGPSGGGKSTLTAILKKLQGETLPRVEEVSIDAYHFPNTYLEIHGLKEKKGRYDTYDVKKLLTDLDLFLQDKTVTFPKYSRRIHEPIPDGPLFQDHENGILLLEGLWLLYRGDNMWGSIASTLDYCYFVDVPDRRGKERTIERHIRGGKTQEEATDFYDSSDRENSKLIIKTRKDANEIIFVP